MKARAHVHISGRVQGVFFRYETQAMAEELGVKGWVRNTPGGKVEAVFEGERGKVEQMLDFCRKGPPGARVTDVEVKWESYLEEFSSFNIRFW
ncbi:MAG: acylphosphatase [Hadesarchaea archaeon DG-33-1]|nr:MAG: acylphosphatase [Hadesarchaea archaeon DG-33-1]